MLQKKPKTDVLNLLKSNQDEKNNHAFYFFVKYL